MAFYNDPFSTPSVEVVRLQIERYRIQHMIPESEIEFSVSRQGDSHALRSFILTAERKLGKIEGKHREIVCWPRDWWQHLKQRWFPKWALKWWPVILASKEFRADALFGLRISLPPNQAVLECYNLVEIERSPEAQ